MTIQQSQDPRQAPRARAIAAPRDAGQTLYRRALLALIAAMIVLAAIVASGPARAQSAPPATFADLVDQVGDAVVNITTSAVVAGRQGPGPMVPEGSPLEDFFNDFLDRRNPEQGPRRSQALGSGFVISEDGYIVTNNHVIEGADEILIEFRGGFTLEAALIGTDPNTDIALLKVEADAPLPFVPFGDSDAMRVGDWVMAMGNPLGQGFSVSVGIVSASGRALSGTYDDYIQTDAAINRGNSGGPLFNLDGEVIGVNTAILSPTGGSIGIGFAMSSDVVTNVVAQLREFGETRRGWLGVRIQDVSADIAESMGLEQARGALVTDVPEGPARAGGIAVGDVILSLDGQDIVDTRALVRMVGESAEGQTVRIIVVRDGATETLNVTLGRRETAEGAATPTAPDGTPIPTPSAEVLGMELVPLTDELRQRLGAQGVSGGLVVEAVDPASDASAKGLEPGDIITEVAQQPVTTVADFAARVETAVDNGQKSILLLIRRAGNPRFVAISLEN
ncbi:serine protease Do [Roseicyclus mahoneyensis]|uniref:Probable periplasmic serine endoprotease DegP-like n=2 Tax=Roseicyclus mahoneyensis TaxID=164332 RepID=A0A316GJK0_9RHOB|nr:serine protease Do [Roseicyclus mahoneyensis]